MGRKHTISVSEEFSTKKSRPALTPEARENQLISLAIDLAEQQIREGTASSQVITHFLKLGSTREKLEQETIKKDQELIEARRESLTSTKTVEELYAKAIEAMKTYSGNREDDNYVEVSSDEPL